MRTLVQKLVMKYITHLELKGTQKSQIVSGEKSVGMQQSNGIDRTEGVVGSYPRLEMFTKDCLASPKARC